MTSGSSTMSAPRIRGLSEEYGILEDNLHVAPGAAQLFGRGAPARRGR